MTRGSFGAARLAAVRPKQSILCTTPHQMIFEQKSQTLVLGDEQKSSHKSSIATHATRATSKRAARGLHTKQDNVMHAFVSDKVKVSNKSCCRAL